MHQFVLISSVLIGSWLGMQTVHELGHVVGAATTGGRVAKVVLHPFTISRTDLASDPHPLIVVWSGPLVGVVIPLLLWAGAQTFRLRCTFVIRFFAGFCLVVNGAYIGSGSFTAVGDAGQMLRHGSPIWTLWLFGAFTFPAGLWLWHRQGVHFGLGAARGNVDVRVAYLSLLLCSILFAVNLAVGG